HAPPALPSFPTRRSSDLIVRVDMRYRPPGGRIGARLARFAGEEPDLQVYEDLRRFKQLIETGEIASTQGQSAGRRSVIGRMSLGDRKSTRLNSSHVKSSY